MGKNQWIPSPEVRGITPIVFCFLEQGEKWMSLGWYLTGRDDLHRATAILEAKIDHARGPMKDMRKELRRLRTDVNYLSLILKGVILTLEKEETLQRDDFFQLLTTIDLEDGENDSQISPRETLK